MTEATSPQTTASPISDALEAFRGRHARSSTCKRKPRPWRALRRQLVYRGLVVPGLTFLERAPWPVVRAFLHGVLRPAAHRALRDATIANLAKVYGDALDVERREGLAREVTSGLVASIEEIVALLRARDPERFLREHVDDREATTRIREIEARYGGLVGVTAHLGNWELIGSWLNTRSNNALGAVVGKRLPNALLNARVEHIRQRLGMTTFYRDEPPTRPIRLLRSGRHVCLVPDQDIKDLGGVFIDFLGHRAYTPVGPARLALAARAPIVCGFGIRGPDGRIRVVIEDPIVPDPSRPRAAEVERLTRAWSRIVERVIREHPGQWAWFHQRWRTTPEKLEARGRPRTTAF